MEHYLIAHDLGTSGNKASLFTTDGKLIRSKTVSYPTHYAPGHIAEQDPNDWWKAVIQSTRDILNGIEASDVLAISFSAQMQGCVLVDKNGSILRPAIIWADHRALAETSHLINRLGQETIYSITGHRPSASYSLEKIMWVQQHEPDIYDQASYMLQAKDYIIHKLTGIFATDASDASGTNAYDLRNHCWSKPILDAANVRHDLFPPILKSSDIAGSLTSQAAKALGLSTHVKVVMGGGDGPCSALGAGCVQPDSLFLTFGTSAWIGGTTDEVFIDPKQRLFCFAHVIPGKYMPCGTMQSAGSAYSYIKDLFYQTECLDAKQDRQDPYDILNNFLGQSPIGSNNLFFLPYLTGERSPYWNPKASGSYIGMAMHHTKPDYLRSVVEGIGYNLRLIFDAYKPQLSTSNMMFTGGGAKGDQVSQILSEILETKLTRPAHVENATSIAAAILAGIGIGLYEDFDIIHDFLPIQDTICPNPSHSAFYNQRLDVFQEIYEALYPIYEKLKSLDITSR
jgi:xylulokinase